MKTNIMLITNNSSLFGNIVSELNRSDIAINIADNSENAIEKFQQAGIDIVFLHHTVNETEKRKLHKIFSLFNEDIQVVEIVEGSNIVNAITNTLNNNMRNSYSFIDDALVNAKFNIRVEE